MYIHELVTLLKEAVADRRKNLEHIPKWGR